MLCFVGAEGAHQHQAEQHQNHWLYLTHADLLPNPCQDTPWQQLYGGQNDHALITPMDFDTASFPTILCGFKAAWNSTTIPNDDVSTTATPRTHCRSLDAMGALGLVLHYLNSTMHKISLEQIVALIPSQCLDVLHSHCRSFMRHSGLSPMPT